MEDDTIIQLYWDRDQSAITATAEKYGGYCHTIARNILGDEGDAEECVNDTWLSAWNAMPPHRPSRLSTFLGKLTRNLSINRYQQRRAEKRGGGELPAVLDELADCVSGGETVEQAMDRKALAEAVNGFLRSLPRKKRGIFLRRYWYADGVSAIAVRYGMKEGAVSMTLHRLRKDLKVYLTERGVTL